MGAGKQEAPPPQAGEPVVLRMELHCAGCAKKVRKSIHHMPGVVSVAADPAANTVVVAGTADAAALKARIESKTKKPVQIVSAPNGKPPPAAEPKKPNHPDKQQQQQQGGGGGGEEKRSPDKGDKDKAGGSSVAKEGKKQPPQEKEPAEETPTTALLRIRLHCDSCADRIRRRICKIKGVKDVVVEGGGVKDEVRVVGTMDVPAMLAYLNGKLNRAVELAGPPGGSRDAAEAAKGAGDDGHVVKKDKGAAEAKGKGIEVVAGPSVASAAASVAAPPGASTHHVSPYGYGHVAYPPQGPPPGYYGNGYYGGGAGGYAGGGGYYQQQQPSSDAGGYYQQQQPSSGYYQQQQPSSDAGGYYQQQQPRGGGYYDEQPRGGGYYDEQPRGGYYGQQQQQQPGGGYEQHNAPAYPFDTAPEPNMFSDENPNSCSLM